MIQHHSVYCVQEPIINGLLLCIKGADQSATTVGSPCPLKNVQFCYRVFPNLQIKDIFNDSKKYKDVLVSQLKYSEKDGMTLVELKLCLVVVTSDSTFIVALVIAKVRTGFLGEEIKVKKDSVKFKPLGKLLSFSQFGYIN